MAIIVVFFWSIFFVQYVNETSVNFLRFSKAENKEVLAYDWYDW